MKFRWELAVESLPERSRGIRSLYNPHAVVLSLLSPSLLLLLLLDEVTQIEYTHTHLHALMLVYGDRAVFGCPAVASGH
jgi:hypothetical protein